MKPQLSPDNLPLYLRWYHVTLQDSIDVQMGWKEEGYNCLNKEKAEEILDWANKNIYLEHMIPLVYSTAFDDPGLFHSMVHFLGIPPSLKEQMEISVHG